MIRFYLDTDDDFDVSYGLDITEEIEVWRTDRAVNRLSRAESQGHFQATLRHGRSLATWWREGRLIEGRVGDAVFFRGFITEAIGQGYGKTLIQARTWLQFMEWRGQTPNVVGLSALEALRSVVLEAAAGLPGAWRPSAALIERVFGGQRPDRLYWGGSDRPLFWRDRSRPFYWRRGPLSSHSLRWRASSKPLAWRSADRVIFWRSAPENVGVFSYGYVGDMDMVSENTLTGPPAPLVGGDAQSVVDRLSAVEYTIENFEYGRFIDEVSVLASIERGWLYSGGATDIAFIGRAASAAPAGAAMSVTRDLFGRYEYEWHVGENAIAQVVGRIPDVQIQDDVIYRQVDVFVVQGASSWRVSVRDRGRPAEVSGALNVIWSAASGISVAASPLAGDLLLEVFNNSGADARLDWIEVSGQLRVYQGGEYGDRVTGRYGGRSIELAGVAGGQAGLDAALDYWGVVGSLGGAEVRTVTLDGRRFERAWSGEIGALMRTDALEAEGIEGGADMYWIVGVRGRGNPASVTVEYELMRYVQA